jgi:histidinol-phosphate aminotransferase
MAKAIRGDTRVVFIANPNNPTGTWLPPRAIREFLEKIPADVLVVLDEAYNEYLDADLRSDAAGWSGEFPNLVVSRTFSKAYGLAGLRVGYGFAHAQVADLMNRVRQPFNVSDIAQTAAAAALFDDEFVEQSYLLNKRGMQTLTDGFLPARAFVDSFACQFRLREGRQGRGSFQPLCSSMGSSCGRLLPMACRNTFG